MYRHNLLKRYFPTYKRRTISSIKQPDTELRLFQTGEGDAGRYEEYNWSVDRRQSICSSREETRKEALENEKPTDRRKRKIELHFIKEVL